MAAALSSGLSQLGLSNALASRVELGFECRNLPSLDLLSKSDPMVIVYLKNNLTGQWQEIHRTEKVKNNENPNFLKKLTMDYYFEELQLMRFIVLDSDSDGAFDLNRHDYIGSFESPLSSLVASNHKPRSLINKSGGNVLKNSKPSVLIIHTEEEKSNAMNLSLKISGKSLDKKDLFGKSDCFLEIFRKRNDNSSVSWQLEHTTEIIMKTLDPNWKEFSINLAKLCNGDLTRPLLFKVSDYDGPSKSDRIGEFETCVAELLGGLPAGSYASLLPNYSEQLEKAAKYNAPVKQFTLRKLDKKDTKDREKSHGTIIIEKATLVLEPTFLDFIRGGMQVSLMVAVDFTGSNGHPGNPGSLHYMGSNNNAPNQYQQAINQIASIVAPYDSDQKFPIWGFGARIGGGTEVQHCFPLTFDPNNQEVFGVQGLLSAYANSITRVELSGPTYFTPVINAATAIASSKPFTPTSQSYYILLLLTDGIFNDMEATIESLVNASDRPLSIIIVGVGNADFSSMKILDGDEKPLESRGKRIRRDLVQFVSFQDFSNKHISALSKETLAEIPKQVLEFAKMYGVGPMTPPVPH